MTTGATGQLGLALPVQGELSGTWGDTVNNGLTQYINIAIAGTLTLTGDGAVTLANTTGDASASNVTSTLAGAGTVTAQFAIVKVSGTTTTKVVTGPSYSKTYVVDNASSYAVTFKASGQTGVSVAAAEKVTVVFNGTDYIKLAGTIANAAGSNTQIQFNNGGLFGASANLTWDGTTLSSTQINITGQGTLRLQDTTGGEYVAHRAPSALGASYTLTWPADDGTVGQALITDGSGVLSWSTAASGDVYGPASSTANGIALFDGTTGKLLKDSASTDGLIYGLTVGRGAGGVSTNTAVGASALAANTSGSNNAAFGISALAANTSALYGTAVGAYALASNTTGNSNTGIGYGSLNLNTTGTFNTALGHGSLQANTTASNNTAVGYQAAYSNTTGVGLTAVGFQTFYSNQTGTTYNTGLGFQAGYSNTTGAYNVFIGGYDVTGYSAGFSNTTGASNVSIGNGALSRNTTASNNTAVGYQAAYNNSTGVQNVAIGRGALQANTTASYNTAVGDVALNVNTTGAFNSALGLAALVANTTGSNNTAFGAQSLAANTTASNNTAVGYQAGYSNTTTTGLTALGYYAGRLYNPGSDSYGSLFAGSLAGAANTTGVNNAFVGGYAGTANTSGSFNSAVGSAALYNNTTGSNNTAQGFQALLSNTTASNNTAVGYQAALYQTGGRNTSIGVAAGSGVSGSTTTTQSTFIGFNAGVGVTSGSYLVFVGDSAGATNTTGSYNIAIGQNALVLNSTGSSNVAMGAFALQANTTASYNTAVGYQAGYGNTTGAYNASFGHAAFNSNSTGNYNTALGTQSLASNTTASNNTAVGYQAGYSNTTGVQNVHLGFQAGRSNITSSGNVYIGGGIPGIQDSAGYYATGSKNTYVGAAAGATSTSGSSNTILGNYNGSQNGLDIRTSSNYIVLSDGDGNPRGIFDNNGSFLINCTSVPSGGSNSTAYDNTGDESWVGSSSGTGGSYKWKFYNGNGLVGSIVTSGSSTAFNTSSDYRLKENIAPMIGALATVAQLKPCTYTWKADGASGQGFIAHELQEVVPDAVVGEKDAVDADGNIKPQGIDTSFLVATLTAAIQEQQAIIESLKARLDAANL